MKTKKDRIFNGNRLRELRGARDQQKLAGLLGVSGASWSAFENGTREPDLATFMKICKILSVSFADLLNIAESVPSTQVHDPPDKDRTIQLLAETVHSQQAELARLKSKVGAAASVPAGGGRVTKTA